MTFAISECHHIVAQQSSRCNFLEKVGLAETKLDAIRRNTRAPTSPDRPHGVRPNSFPGSRAKCNVTCMCIPKRETFESANTNLTIPNNP
ncbi:hypothetical protein HBI17_063300 [Parastagonospora nodorum]|nr:hypothetical protein HBI06_109530 [Parastagonospora nodorum]KAH4248137.1 hypothetical protein HBI05_037100 [Parastagonospora nodorum]KAH5627106.1 hypothetical protein HBI51_220180 [Parastagonospora nodorum]KAH5667107.1 hypothetical protein HBI21_223730 [Parastagonospora nodorum]KAH5700987.1 hypothetical protein HBI44_047340 [Parastagonospora nodorum]